MYIKPLTQQVSQTGNARFRRDLGAIALGLLVALFTLGSHAQTSNEPAAAAEKITVTEVQVATSRGIPGNVLSITGKVAPNENVVTTKPRIAATQNASKSAPAKSGQYNDFEIYDAEVTLYFDDDLDGFYYGIDVNFDADTQYSVADVYARLYLSLEGGPWELYYTTEVFTLIGDSGTDDYTVETELYSGYPPAYYDVLIELYDYDTDDFVAEFGPQDSAELRDIPLEDQQKDVGIVIIGPEPIISHSNGGGGSTSLLALVLAALALAARRRTQNVHPVRLTQARSIQAGSSQNRSTPAG